jgi:stearoyl-CoA desaturase (delta-9 desaturase)
MSFLDRVLEVPSYGYVNHGHLYVPTRTELFREFFSRLNLVKSRKNWLPAWGWFASSMLSVPLFFFLKYYFNWYLLGVGLVYSMIGLGTHGTVYLHRFSTHRAYQFRNVIWKFMVKNLVIKIIPEEVYVVSHHVHHHIPERPGDPYNVHGGWLYCFLADVNHQLIARDLSEKDYLQLAKLVTHTGIRVNNYQQYLKWGSLCHPFYTLLHYGLNWVFWYGVFFWLGGHALATAIFGVSVFWAFGIRTFNFDGHGGGINKQRDGVDFNNEDLSINRLWPGFVAGEWHNNHHLYPNSARSGFLFYQLDLAWYFIQICIWLGGIRSYRDCKGDFMKYHYYPYLLKRQQIKGGVASPVVPLEAQVEELLRDFVRKQKLKSEVE